MEDRHSEPPKSPEPDATIPVRVLIVEDDPGNQVLLNLQVKGGDPMVSTVLTDEGEKALELLRTAKEEGQTPFDLVISDQGLMGVMKGVELGALAKKEELCARFTLFSGSLAGITPEQRKASGIDNFLRKGEAGLEQIRNEVRQARIIKSPQLQ